ncbi:MAG TPA: hypothetical protein VF316_00920 [Polyangiaceae bacterium]
MKLSHALVSVGALVVVAACGGSEPQVASDAGKDGAAASCVSAGGMGCYSTCSGTYHLVSGVDCGAGLHCCADTTLDASALDAGSCPGMAPLCFGADVTKCCGHDPAGAAQCVGGAWTCGTAPAPGCNGQSCLAQDAAAD